LNIAEEEQTNGHKPIRRLHRSWGCGVRQALPQFLTVSVRTSETSIAVYPMTRRNVPEDSNLQQYRCENLCLCSPGSHSPSVLLSDALLSLLGHLRRSVWLKKTASVMKQQETQCSQNCQLRRHGFILCHLLSHLWRQCFQLPSSVLGRYLGVKCSCNARLLVVWTRRVCSELSSCRSSAC